MRFFYDIKRYFRYLILATKSQLQSEVTNSYLDWVWWILEPVCSMLVYTLIFGHVFNAAEPHFEVFVFIGVSMWAFFNKTVTESVKLIKMNKAIVTKVYIPKQMLLIKLMFVNAFKMALSFLIIFVLMIIYHIKLSYLAIGIIPVLVIFFMITYGICCFLMHYGVYVEDLAYITSILLKMMMYFTGVFYSVEKRMPKPFGHLLNNYNPIAFLISEMRNALLGNETGLKLGLLLFWFVIAALLSSLGTRLIYKNENSYVKVL